VNAESTRPPAVAGSFYPGSADELRREVKGYLDAAPAPPVDGEVVGILVPHAGYRFSAAVAAYGYKALAGVNADTVVIIGHDANARGVVAFLSDEEAFETPLGRVAVDTELVAALAKANPGIIVRNQAHRREHSVEVQLPFLQTLLPGCRIVPILFGDPRPETCHILADALAANAGQRRLLLIASTDLCHYPSDAAAVGLVKETMAYVEKTNVPALFTYLDETRRSRTADNVQTAMCGSGGVGTALIYAQASGPISVRILRLANSGDVPGGDKARVVGYASAVITRKPQAATAPPADAKVQPAATPPADAKDQRFAVAPEVQKELLTLARRRIAATARREPFSYEPPPAMADVLGPRAAVFVTLKKDGRLRGCIGMTEPRAELWRAVQDMAQSAAFRDPRFAPVGVADLEALHIEISVLSPLAPVAAAAAIVPKQHGVVVRRGGRSGLFLPQVWEQLPDKERFLSVLCSEKAGLPADAWKDPETRLLVFTVFAFEEP
jgi:AmmeMemoRadiSam system protein B/AmmeMemoRadiSam system protein A